MMWRYLNSSYWITEALIHPDLRMFTSPSIFCFYLFDSNVSGQPEQRWIGGQTERLDRWLLMQIDRWCNLGHCMDSGLHTVCWFISVCTSAVCVISMYPAGTHTHTSLSLIGTNAFRHILLECVNFLFKAQRNGCIMVDSSSLSPWALWTHTLSDLSPWIFLCLTVCVCVCACGRVCEGAWVMCERKTLQTWGPLICPH